MVIENYEEKNKAYELYPQLPLKKKSVLMIKFYHIIHQGLMITGLFILLYSIYLKDKDILNTSYQFIVFFLFYKYNNWFFILPGCLCFRFYAFYKNLSDYIYFIAGNCYGCSYAAEREKYQYYTGYDYRVYK
jgi:hypothetical protein